MVSSSRENKNKFYYDELCKFVLTRPLKLVSLKCSNKRITPNITPQTFGEVALSNIKYI